MNGDQQKVFQIKDRRYYKLQIVLAVYQKEGKWDETTESLADDMLAYVYKSMSPRAQEDIKKFEDSKKKDA